MFLDYIIIYGCSINLDVPNSFAQGHIIERSPALPYLKHQSSHLIMSNAYPRSVPSPTLVLLRSGLTVCIDLCVPQVPSNLRIAAAGTASTTTTSRVRPSR